MAVSGMGKDYSIAVLVLYCIGCRENLEGLRIPLQKT